MLWRFLKGAAESSYCRYVCVTKVVRSFLEDLRLVEMKVVKAASEELDSTRAVLDVTRSDNEVISSVDGYKVLMYVKTAAAHT